MTRRAQCGAKAPPPLVFFHFLPYSGKCRKAKKKAQAIQGTASAKAFKGQMRKVAWDVVAGFLVLVWGRFRGCVGSIGGWFGRAM